MVLSGMQAQDDAKGEIQNVKSSDTSTPTSKLESVTALVHVV